MTLLLKDPQSALSYSVDWGAEYLVEDVLAASSWSVEPDEPGGLAIRSERHDYTIASAELEGGIGGRVYRLTNSVETAAGRLDSRSFIVRVEAR